MTQSAAAAGPEGVTGGLRLLLRLEGLALFAGAVALYAATDHSWLLFAALFLAPDVSFAAYLAGPRAGALCYNLVHTTIGPIALWVAGSILTSPVSFAVALIWLAHIGIDRALGYGLKYDAGFSFTHLGCIGPRRT
jgi:Domain of unknown function (DUF4260)